MTPNKKTVEIYMDGFNKSDDRQILSCLTDDVEWVLPGIFHVTGKEAFDKEIENDAFISPPAVATTRLVEENDVVVAEGTVRVKKKDGGLVNLAFCDVFLMRDGKIRKLISYLVPVQ